jgi:predicted metal-dependent peptidase
MINFDTYLKVRKALNESSDAPGIDPKTDEYLTPARARIKRATAKAYTKFPFFGEFLADLRIIYTYTLGGGRPNDTMATDGANIYINPKFTMDITDEQALFVLCHEIMHVVLEHHSRMGSRNLQNWNIASDYELNPYLVDEGLLRATDLNPGTKNFSGLYDKKYIDEKSKKPFTAEAIYNTLGNEAEENSLDSLDSPDLYAPVQVGSLIQTKDGKFGEVTKINMDETFDIKELTKEEVELRIGQKI